MTSTDPELVRARRRPDAPAWEFTATGTRWRIYHSGGADERVASTIALAVARDEARWSRFRDDSELSALNRGAGSWQRVSPEMLELLDVCESWRCRTDGVFQPLIGSVLAGWGYERSVAHRAPFARTTPTAGAVTGSLDLDTAHGLVRIPRGTTIDLGGIGKGWMASRAARLARALCADPALLIDAGGDLLAVTGEHVVAVKAGGGASAPPQAWIRLGPGQAAATSGFEHRHWVNGDGRFSHHLIDPATGAPGPLAHATVVADDAATADVTATVLALRPDEVHRTAYPALVTTPEQTRRAHPGRPWRCRHGRVTRRLASRSGVPPPRRRDAAVASDRLVPAGGRPCCRSGRGLRS